MDNELKLWLINKVKKPELSIPVIERSLSIKLAVGLFFVALLVSPSRGLNTDIRLNDDSPVATNDINQEWYEGGDLHQASALVWQEADSRNKLATCADLIFAMKDSGLLRSEITQKLNSIQDYRDYAYQLSTALDAAFKKERDSELNIKIFTNQEVHTTAVMLAGAMQWTD